MKHHLVQSIRSGLFALSLGCMLFFFSSPHVIAGIGPAGPGAAGFSLRCVAAVGSCDSSQAKACGCESSNESSNESNRMANPAGGVLCAAWYDVVLNSRRNTMQAAFVIIMIGIFILRKTNYRS